MFNRISFSHHRTTADYSLAVDVAAAAAAAAAAVAVAMRMQACLYCVTQMLPVVKHHAHLIFLLVAFLG